MATMYFGSNQESLGHSFPFLIIYNPIHYTTNTDTSTFMIYPESTISHCL